eukprot:1393594-Amorphochlora_amoeboformis.AAC.1
MDLSQKERLRQHAWVHWAACGPTLVGDAGVEGFSCLLGKIDQTQIRFRSRSSTGIHRDSQGLNLPVHTIYGIHGITGIRGTREQLSHARAVEHCRDT